MLKSIYEREGTTMLAIEDETTYEQMYEEMMAWRDYLADMEEHTLERMGAWS